MNGQMTIVRSGICSGDTQRSVLAELIHAAQTQM
jgi:hypothetical protein